MTTTNFYGETLPGYSIQGGPTPPPAPTPAQSGGSPPGPPAGATVTTFLTTGGDGQATPVTETLSEYLLSLVELVKWS